MLRILRIILFWIPGAVLLLLCTAVILRAEPRREAESLVRGQQGGLEGMARDGSGLGERVPGFTTAAPGQTGYGGGQMGGDAALMTADPDTPEGGAAAAVRRAVDRRPEARIDANDSMFDRAKRVETNPDATLQGLLTGTYSDCAVDLGQAGTGGETRFCDSYYSQSEAGCSVERQIDVEAKHDYECHRDRRRFTRTCVRRASVVWRSGAPRVTWTESCADSS